MARTFEQLIKQEKPSIVKSAKEKAEKELLLIKKIEGWVASEYPDTEFTGYWIATKDDEDSGHRYSHCPIVEEGNIVADIIGDGKGEVGWSVVTPFSVDD